MNRTSQRSSRLLTAAMALLCALALLGAACSSSSEDATTATVTETETTVTDQAEDGVDDAAPSELAEVDVEEEPDLASSEDDPSEDTMGSDAMESDAMGSNAMESDAMESGEEAEDAADEDRRDLTETALNAPSKVDVINEEASECVSETFEDRPELRAVWDAIMTDRAASEVDAGAEEDAVKPILECVSFGEIVSAVVSTDMNVELSEASITCMDSAMDGKESMLVDLISSDKIGGMNNDLIVAMVQCVTEDELTALMEDRG